jgi:hypothetical protein
MDSPAIFNNSGVLLVGVVDCLAWLMFIRSSPLNCFLIR